MAVIGIYGIGTPAVTGPTDTELALANKVRELELKVAHLDEQSVESDDIDTQTTLQELER